MKSIKVILISVFVLSLILTACGPSSSIADIVFVIGDGSVDQNIHEIIYPNQQMATLATDRTTKVAPGNYRNYIINDGTQLNLDGTKVGDSPNLLKAVLSTDTRVMVGLKALWMLNQNAYKDENGIYTKGPLVEFYKFADKYGALHQTNDKTGNVNSSTPEWNKMLSETFYTTLSHALSQALYNIANNYDSLTGDPMDFKQKIDDKSWKNDDVLQKEALAKEISRLFQSEMAKQTGVQDKMFCGSGTQSGWKNTDPAQAGQPGNTFECADVRIQVDVVSYDPDQGNASGSQSLIDANRAQYQAAWELYHDQTDCWLGIENAINACARTGGTCIINIDAGSCNPNNADGTKSPNQIVLPNVPTPTPAVPTATVTP